MYSPVGTRRNSKDPSDRTSVRNGSLGWSRSGCGHGRRPSGWPQVAPRLPVTSTFPTARRATRWPSRLSVPPENTTGAAMNIGSTNLESTGAVSGNQPSSTRQRASTHRDRSAFRGCRGTVLVSVVSAATGSLRSHHTATVFPIGGTSVTRWLGEPHLVVGETRLGAVEARHQRIQLPLLTVRRLRDVGAPRTAVLTARPGRASRSARPRRSGRP